MRSGVRGDGGEVWGTGALGELTMEDLLSCRRPCTPQTIRCVVSSLQSSLQSGMHKLLWKRDLERNSSPVGTRGVSRRYAPRSPVGTRGVSRRYAGRLP